jgi:hypothetical protein
MEFAEAPGSRVKGKIFKAWLSSSSGATFNGNNREFVIHDLPYHNVYNQMIFEDLWDLNVGLAHQVYDHLGNFPDGYAYFPWTGIMADGTSAADTCLDWTTMSDGGIKGRYGALDSVSFGEWTSDDTITCNEVGSLLCFEQ